MTSLPALDRWVEFANAVSDANLVEHVEIEDAVAALIDRSMVEEDIDAGIAIPDGDLGRLAAADQHFRNASSHILKRTGAAAYGHDEPATYWWWHIEQPSR